MDRAAVVFLGKHAATSLLRNVPTYAILAVANERSKGYRFERR
jgi:hypothetical protein